ncbi:MAG: inverse autotransporter beta domain-containing protein [Alphaproteobacteria bacterium]|nr:inverse autotransporter beta domain-containing protein [Alphaproteobacteria bacterium]
MKLSRTNSEKQTNTAPPAPGASENARHAPRIADIATPALLLLLPLFLCGLLLSASVSVMSRANAQDWIPSLLPKNEPMDLKVKSPRDFIKSHIVNPLENRAISEVVRKGEKILQRTVDDNFSIHSNLRHRELYGFSGDITLISPVVSSRPGHTANFIQGTLQLEDHALGHQRDTSVGFVMRRPWGKHKGIVGHGFFFDENRGGHQRLGFSSDYQDNKTRFSSNIYLPLTKRLASLDTRGGKLTHSYVLPGYDIHLERDLRDNIRIRLSGARWHTPPGSAVVSPQDSLRVEAEVALNRNAVLGFFHRGSSYESAVTGLKTMRRSGYGLRLGLTFPARDTLLPAMSTERMSLWTPVQRKPEVFRVALPTDNTADPAAASEPSEPEVVPLGKPDVSIDVMDSSGAPMSGIHRDEEAKVIVRRPKATPDELRLAVALEGAARRYSDYEVRGLDNMDGLPLFLTIAANEEDASFTIRSLSVSGDEDSRDIRVCVMRGEVSETPGAELCGSDVTVGETIMLLGTSRVVGGSGDINGDDGADVKDGDNDGAAADPSASADNTPTDKGRHVKSSDTNDNSPDSAVVNQPAAKDDTSDPAPDQTGKPPVTVDAPREIRRGETAGVIVSRPEAGPDELWLAVTFREKGTPRRDYTVEGLMDFVVPRRLVIPANETEGRFTIHLQEVLGNEDPRDIKVCVMRGEVSETPGAELCGPDVSIIKTITLLGTNRVVGTGF